MGNTLGTAPEAPFAGVCLASPFIILCYPSTAAPERHSSLQSTYNRLRSQLSRSEGNEADACNHSTLEGLGRRIVNSRSA
jgi:hypothetical protein